GTRPAPCTPRRRLGFSAEFRSLGGRRERQGGTCRSACRLAYSRRWESSLGGAITLAEPRLRFPQRDRHLALVSEHARIGMVTPLVDLRSLAALAAPTLALGRFGLALVRAGRGVAPGPSRGGRRGAGRAAPQPRLWR